MPRSVLIGALFWLLQCAGPHAQWVPPSELPIDMVRITGRERLGWTQQADTATQLASFKYVLYANDVAVDLSGVSCTRASSAFDCAAPLPWLATGAAQASTRREALLFKGDDFARTDVLAVEPPPPT